MEATPVTATISILGTDYPVQSVSLVKRIGSVSSGNAQIQLIQNQKGQPITGDEVASLAALFKDAILNKTDAEPNVSINLMDQLDFEGILLGAQGSINASGTASFNVSFAEPAIMFNSMNLNCYPSDLSGFFGIVERVTARHPFVRKKSPTGPITTRIKQLYQTAIESTREDTGYFADRIFAQQRAINAALESMFFGVMDRSVSETNLEWLSEANPVLNSHVNDTLAWSMFNGEYNFWQTLMRIAHLFNLIYVGDFQEGGFFKQLDLEDEVTDLTLQSTQTRNLLLGKSSQQTIGQVAAYASNTQTGFKPLNLTGRQKKQQDKELLAAYPEEPLPSNGKIITMTAPSCFTIGRKTEEKNYTDDNLDRKDDGSVEDVVGQMARREQEYENNKEENYNALRLWCRDKYNLLRSRNLQAVVTKPFTLEEYPLGSPAMAAPDITGILNSVQHEVSVQGDTGRATTTYNIAYVGAPS